MSNIISGNNSGLGFAMQLGLSGYQKASQQFFDASMTLANQSNHRHASSSLVDINKASIDLVQAELHAKASGEVIKRADGMIGTIIDTFA